MYPVPLICFDRPAVAPLVFLKNWCQDPKLKMKRLGFSSQGLLTIVETEIDWFVEWTPWFNREPSGRRPFDAHLVSHFVSCSG